LEDVTDLQVNGNTIYTVRDKDVVVNELNGSSENKYFELARERIR